MRSRGFSLLEVLIAIVVLSIGLLGLAGMMASTMRNNHSAYHRTQATWLAYDVIDRVRVNRQVALAPNNNYNVAIGAATASTGIAATDINDWKTRLAEALPEGDGSVAVNAGNRTVTVIIQWNDARGTQGNETQQFRVDTQL
ncbi:type IV pilus modification protein PilV [Parazoarcus communis]|uniref:type IV pilus modification protein PilV n=1 Tax=Parazoarcus communis TaxID=41977 RepID=UPI002006EEDB|nr:type IV pilus modification protein PilV [Parazoarcus communis]